MTQPKVLMLDEPTAGVSPIVMDELFDRIIEFSRTGIAILMVEQNAKLGITSPIKALCAFRDATAADTGQAFRSGCAKHSGGWVIVNVLNALVLIMIVIVPGLAYGSQLALGALGVALVYGVLRFSNFAWR